MKNAHSIFQAADNTHMQTLWCLNRGGRGRLMKTHSVWAVKVVGEVLIGLPRLEVSPSGLTPGCCLQSTLQLSEGDRPVRTQCLSVFC